MKTGLSLIATLLCVGLSACEGPPTAPQPAWQLGRHGVYALDRPAPRGFVPLPGWFWADAPWACAPELAVGPRGEAVVTSNVAPILWRVDRQTLGVSMHELALDADNDKDVGFSALVYQADRDAYFAISTADGALWRIDAGLTRAEKLAAPIRNPFNGDTTCATS